MQKVLNLLGIAKRASKTILGTDSVIVTLQANKLKLIFIASDASNGTFDKLDKKAYYYKVPIVSDYTTEQLSKALGVTLVKVVGVTDEGFAGAMLKELERGDF